MQVLDQLQGVSLEQFFYNLYTDVTSVVVPTIGC